MTKQFMPVEVFLNSMGTLILVRHGQSEYNAQGLWCGFTDSPLTEQGLAEAREAGEAIKDQKLDVVFISDLIRSKQTWEEMAKVLGSQLVPVVAPEIKERDYGELAGQNKWDLKEKYGLEQWMKWRRSWDEVVPGGESLKDVFARVIPYYQQTIEPLLKQGQTVLLSAHGNSLRALVKHLDNISDQDVEKLEIATGGILLYKIDEQGRVISKERRAAIENKA